MVNSAGLVFLILILSFGQVFASDVSTELAWEYIQLTPLASEAQTTYQAYLRYQKRTQKNQKFLDKISSPAEAKQTVDKLNVELIKIVKKNYTQKQLKQIILFLRSPDGEAYRRGSKATQDEMAKSFGEILNNIKK